jgi:hypothetical protein
MNNNEILRVKGMYNCIYANEIPCLSWNPKVHYHAHKSLPLVPRMSHMDSVHTLTPYFFKIHFNIFPSINAWFSQVVSSFQMF